MLTSSAESLTNGKRQGGDPYHPTWAFLILLRWLSMKKTSRLSFYGNSIFFRSNFFGLQFLLGHHSIEQFTFLDQKEVVIILLSLISQFQRCSISKICLKISKLSAEPINHPWGKLSMGQAVHGASCPWAELSTGRAVHGVRCPWGELSMGRAVHGASFRGARCPWGQLPKGRAVHGVSCS